MKNSKVIKINKKNYETIKNDFEGSFNEKINKLLDVTENIMPFLDYSNEMKSINLYKSTADRLDSFRLTETESRDNIISRLLICYEDNIKNIPTVDDWTSFKITCTVNKKLVVEGYLDNISKEILFKSNGELYGYLIPSKYIVDGEDLTNEFKIWVNTLSWEHLKIQIESYGLNYKKITSDNYELEVNLNNK